MKASKGDPIAVYHTTLGVILGTAARDFDSKRQKQIPVRAPGKNHGRLVWYSVANIQMIEKVNH
jgi:hypothetical protein